MFSLILALTLAVSAMCYPALAASEKVVVFPGTDEAMNISVATSEDSMMATRASYYYDGTWELYHATTSIYGEIEQSSCTSVADTSGSVSALRSVCTYAYTEQDENGNPAFVRFRVTYQTPEGVSYDFGNVGTHYNKGSVTLRDSVTPTGCTFYGDYSTAGVLDLYYGFEGTLSE